VHARHNFQTEEQEYLSQEHGRSDPAVLAAVPAPERQRLAGWTLPVAPTREQFRGQGVAEPSRWIPLATPPATTAASAAPDPADGGRKKNRRPPVEVNPHFMEWFRAVYYAHTSNFKKRKKTKADRDEDIEWRARLAARLNDGRGGDGPGSPAAHGAAGAGAAAEAAKPRLKKKKRLLVR
jgi:hypothetical protein